MFNFLGCVDISAIDKESGDAKAEQSFRWGIACNLHIKISLNCFETLAFTPTPSSKSPPRKRRGDLHGGGRAFFSPSPQAERGPGGEV